MDINCDFCGSESFKNRPLKVYSQISKKSVSYYRCKECASLRQFPLPDEKTITDYYESYKEIKSEMNPGYLEQSQLAPFFKERDMTLAEIGFDTSAIKEQANVEVGCANGHFLRYLKSKEGSEVTGIDISQSLLDSIVIDDVKLLAGDLSLVEADSIGNLFLFNVLEHFRELHKEMALVESRLKKDGNLIVEVPLAGLVSNFFSARWRFLMPDEHLHIPSIKGLKMLLAAYGFKIIGATRFGSGFTTGMINNGLKRALDRLAKQHSFGDRGAFLCKRL